MLHPPLTTFEDFIAVYPVHTADMSLALTNGWSRALESFCKERFQWDVIPSAAREAMLGYCGRHLLDNNFYFQIICSQTNQRM